MADPGPARPGHGNGIRNMHERARWLGGRLEVSPAPDGGTRVSVAIPLDFEAPDQVDVPPASEVSSR
jgi:two-component system sensor histidine kinase UhpB